MQCGAPPRGVAQISLYNRRLKSGERLKRGVSGNAMSLPAPCAVRLVEGDSVTPLSIPLSEGHDYCPNAPA